MSSSSSSDLHQFLIPDGSIYIGSLYGLFNKRSISIKPKFITINGLKGGSTLYSIDISKKISDVLLYELDSVNPTKLIDKVLSSDLGYRYSYDRPNNPTYSTTFSRDFNEKKQSPDQPDKLDCFFSLKNKFALVSDTTDSRLFYGGLDSKKDAYTVLLSLFRERCLNADNCLIIGLEERLYGNTGFRLQRLLKNQRTVLFAIWCNNNNNTDNNYCSDLKQHICAFIIHGKLVNRGVDNVDAAIIRDINRHGLAVIIGSTLSCRFNQVTLESILSRHFHYEGLLSNADTLRIK